MFFIAYLFFSIMDQESQQRGRGQNKHNWTTHEDKTLIEALIELSTKTLWQGDMDFKMTTYSSWEK